MFGTKSLKRDLELIALIKQLTATVRMQQLTISLLATRVEALEKKTKS